MSLRRLEIEAVRADLAQVDEMLRSISEDTDPIGYHQFLLRKDELSAQLIELDKPADANASVGLFFGGRPIYGSKGVAAEFAAKIIGAFQEVVAKRLASKEVGNLAKRGPVPLRPISELMITDMARGSVGLILEEASQQESLADSSLKFTIDQVVDLLADVGAEDESIFEQAAESLDARQLKALQGFFSALDDYGATVRLVEEVKERSLDAVSVLRGRARTEAMQIEEQDDVSITGRLLGLIPEHRRFELQRSDSHEVIYGSVSAEYSKAHMDLLGKVEGKVWRTKMRIREVRRRNRSPKFSYTLLGLVEEIKE